MKIKKLTIKNFKKFNDKSFTFTEGVNVIQGLNEAGKSTLSQAMLVLLFGDPATRSKQFLDSYASWDQSGSIFLQAEGVTNGGEFMITKDFGLRLSKLVNLTSKKEANDPQTVQKGIANLLGGISSQKVYESTAFIRQSEIARIEKGSDLISAIQKAASASGMEGGVQDVLKKIDKDLLELKKGLDRPTNNPGKIRKTQMELEEIKGSLEQMKMQWDKVKDAAQQEKTSQGGLDEIKEKISFIETQLENNKRFKDASEKVRNIEQHIVRLEMQLSEVSDLSSQISQTEEKLKSLGDFQGLNLETLAEKVNELKVSMNTKKETLKKLSEEHVKKEKSENDDEEESKSKTLPIVGVLLLVVVAPLVFIVLHNMLAAIIAAVAGIAIGGYGLIGYFKKDSKEGEQSKVKEETSASLSKEIEEEEVKLNELIAKYKFKDLDHFYTSKAKISALLSEKSNLEATLKGMLGGKALEDIKKEQAELLSQKKTLEVNELTEDVQNAGLSSEEYLRRRRELDTLKMEERRLVQLEAQSKVRVEDAGVSIDDITEAEEQLEMLEEELKYYEKRKSVLELTRAAIEEAVESTAQDAGKIIREFVKGYLEKITQNRYTDIKVEKDLSIQVFSKDKGDWIDPVSTLSAGTIDQIYFLTRLAFLKLVAKGSNPPIILDDPFVTFDKNRRESTKEILHEIAKDHQIILLTHHDDYSDWGNVVKI